VAAKVDIFFKSPRNIKKKLKNFFLLFPSYVDAVFNL